MCFFVSWPQESERWLLRFNHDEITSRVLLEHKTFKLYPLSSDQCHMYSALATSVVVLFITIS